MKIIDSGIYIIQNLINKKFYLGSTNNFKRRKAEHIYYLEINKHHSIKLQRAWNKYGEKNFKFYIFFRCAISVLKDVEQFYLNLYKSYIYGYNISENAIDCHDEPSEEIRKKISDFARKRKLSDEHKKRIGDSLRGKKKTKQHCFNIGNSSRGRKWSDEARRRKSELSKKIDIVKNIQNKFKNR